MSINAQKRSSSAAVDRQDLPRNEGRVVRAEECHAVRDVDRAAQPLHESATDNRGLLLGAVGLPLLFGVWVRAKESGRH